MRSIYRKHPLYMKHFFQMAQQLLLLTAYLNNSLRFQIYTCIYIYSKSLYVVQSLYFGSKLPSSGTYKKKKSIYIHINSQKICT